MNLREHITMEVVPQNVAGSERQSQEGTCVLRMRYLPEASLEECDLRYDSGLERILYFQALLNE